MARPRASRSRHESMGESQKKGKENAGPVVPEDKQERGKNITNVTSVAERRRPAMRGKRRLGEGLKGFVIEGE